MSYNDLKFIELQKTKYGENDYIVLSKLEGGKINANRDKLFINKHNGTTPSKGLTFEAETIMSVVQTLLKSEKHFTKDDITLLIEQLMQVKNRMP